MSKANKFKAAVVGCGKIGAEIDNYYKAVQPATHAGAYHFHKDIKLVALVDKDKKKLTLAGRYFPEAKLYLDVKRMLKENRPDIVSIATPTKYHRENVLEVAQFRCPAILCEKPIAYSINEAKSMINACKRNGSQLFINYQRRFDSLLNKWSERVKDGILGQIYQGNAYYCNGLFNNGSHLINLLQMFLGEPISVIGRYNKATSSLPGDPNVDGLIIFPNSLIVSIHSLSKNYDYFDLRILGEKGMLEISDLSFQIQYTKKIISKKYKGYFELSKKTFREGKPRSMMLQVVNHIVAFLKHRVESISQGEDGLATLKVLLALRQSAETHNQEIKIL